MRSIVVLCYGGIEFGGVRCVLILLVALQALRSIRGDWVEIPHIKPPAGQGLKIQGHLSQLRNMAGHQEAAELFDHSRDQWSRLDYTTKHSTLPVVANVSSKIETIDYEQDEVDEKEHDYSRVQTALLPFGNRYGEEYINAMPQSPSDPKTMMNYERYYVSDDVSIITPPEHHEHQLEAPEELEETDSLTLAAENQPARVHQPETPPIHSLSEGIGSFLNFLRHMQASFVLRTAHSINEKIDLLTGLRDQLLDTIQRRIGRLWVPSVPKIQRRNRRQIRLGWTGHDDDGNNGVDFPSAESALLTISFLTFAVFLIKLVLQVINTIKAKHYTYSTFAASSGSTPVAGGLFVKRVRRTLATLYSNEVLLDEVNTGNILRAIESYERS
ncbi:uncharacterized protein LOC126581268 [Anopheles aquasalis]|uniref:uncharacterized protein LOC126581268 n=1 Tax=Anopheles aquasalis TaxID=42839 RepID=UPI00215A7E2F|nr:uncharacterized protein LOC126581268 [Anopheles aquasalis]